jgi:tRNA uridine 5-carboxymethylaminomethyl modification enzyme
MDNKYNVVVIGAGHAGCEASLASARIGLKTLIITLNIDSIANMPCNPAIGGIAKGQIVREIDAMGGEIGIITDNSCLQFKMLNSSKGQAVWSPRAQCDKAFYSTYMTKSLQNQQNLDILQSEVTSIIVKNKKTYGIKILTGEIIKSDVVIVATGTFLNATIHLGKQCFYGGRFNERNSSYLSKSLIYDCGLKIKRFKTTTTPRINSRTIDYSKIIKQFGDINPAPFSHFTNIKKWVKTLKQLPCWLTYTNKVTHKIVNDNLNVSSINIGTVNSKSPRYCPSIEEKIERYPEKENHRIFIEPEGYNTNEIYLNGLYTGLPFKIQKKIINSIVGLENATVIRYGYAIEYDYSDPLQIKHTLETKQIENLFLAGQINGTTGYEEAAAQGFVAGANAALKILNKNPLILERNNSYIGVLIDDIITKGVDEPYRIFTSRSEFRLSVRNDNADLRLIEIGYSIGLISKKIYKKFVLYKDTITKLKNNINIDINNKSLYPWSIDKAKNEIEIQKKYYGYIKIQNLFINKIKKNERKKIPKNIDYDKINYLSTETKEKFKKIKPETIGQASRIPGIRHSDIAMLVINIEKNKKQKQI